jgi:hypothetical protein
MDACLVVLHQVHRVRRQLDAVDHLLARRARMPMAAAAMEPC